MTAGPNPFAFDPAPLPPGAAVPAPRGRLGRSVPPDPVPYGRAPDRRAGGRRGQGLAWTTLVVAVLAAVVTGWAVYRALDAADVVSADPVGPSIGWIVLAVSGLVAGVVVLLLAVAAVMWCRPRLVAALALVAAVVAPVVAVSVAATTGWAVLKLHVAQDLTADGPAAAAAGRDVLDAFGVTGPFRDLLDGWAG